MFKFVIEPKHVMTRHRKTGGSVRHPEFGQTISLFEPDKVIFGGLITIKGKEVIWRTTEEETRDFAHSLLRLIGDEVEDETSN